VAAGGGGLVEARSTSLRISGIHRSSLPWRTSGNESARIDRTLTVECIVFCKCVGENRFRRFALRAVENRPLARHPFPPVGRDGVVEGGVGLVEARSMSLRIFGIRRGGTATGRQRERATGEERVAWSCSIAFLSLFRSVALSQFLWGGRRGTNRRGAWPRLCWTRVKLFFIYALRRIRQRTLEKRPSASHPFPPMRSRFRRMGLRKDETTKTTGGIARRSHSWSLWRFRLFALWQPLFLSHALLRITLSSAGGPLSTR
jgi:hypothetical protein